MEVSFSGHHSVDRAAALRWSAALLSLGAAGVHFAVAPEHFAEYWLFGWFFVTVAWLQAAWALAVVGSASRLIVGLALIGNLVLILIWAWTRTIGVPLGPEAGESEAFAIVDGLAVALEIGVIIGCIALWQHLPAERQPLSAALVVVALASVALIVLIGISLMTGEDNEGHAEEPDDAAATPRYE